MENINQFPPNTIKAIRQYERIKKKICRQKMSIMFNEICLYIYRYIGSQMNLNLVFGFYYFRYLCSARVFDYVSRRLMMAGVIFGPCLYDENYLDRGVIRF